MRAWPITQLKLTGINFIAVDFDLTLVDTHTEGRWSKTADDLAEHARPSVLQLLHAALNEGFHVAIVTLSSQVGLC